ncbi:hypothetical protein AZOA_12030 [Azoarcus sp. Aa7]|nr:hypothetical protein [Azoarcus sp. Aa7]
MSLKPWREIAVPHEDVLKGTFQQAEFAADLSRVHEGTATAEYQDPKLFFQRTFITEGMRLLLDSVVKRLTNRGGDPVIQLQTAFGGGKTHTMMAVYHLAKGGTSASDLQGVSQILDGAGVTELPRARLVVLDGVRLLDLASKPYDYAGTTVRTLWGELAWQLGGAAAYEQVRHADDSGTAPGKQVLAELLSHYAPCVILVDELVRYVAQFEDGKALSGGSFDSNLSFIQALTEALKAVPNAMLLASLPESEKEAVSQRGVKALRTLEHYFARVQAIWKPVATEEAFEIVRRRLFARIDDTKAAESVCRAFADFYVANGQELPHETQEGRYLERLVHAYPIHPEVFDRLYEDWSSLDNFQRTRGVLKLMAKAIHRLWQDGNNDPLIMPGSLPLYDADTRNEVIYYLPQGWDPVLERDVDGDRAETTSIESVDTRLGSVQACRRTARTVFLGSAPSTANQMVRGIEQERVLLGVALPGQQIGLFKDALRRLSDRLHYLNSGNNRFWFDTRPNLRREMEDRKRRFKDREDVLPAIHERIQRSFASSLFGGIHVFAPSGDIPDDWQLRLVVLPPDAGFSRGGPNLATDYASDILKSRGEQPRFKKNRLLFLAPDYDSVSRLRDHVRSMLAWQSIVRDIKDLKLNLDLFQSRQAEKSLEDAGETVRRMIRETYKWIVTPMQEARPGKGLSEVQWEHFQINPGAPNLSQEIERVLHDNELLISSWAPIHLATMLKTWFWKGETNAVSALQVWQQTCQQLYLPRLKDDTVFQHTMMAGAESTDFFGFAQGIEGEKYVGFSFGRRASLFFDAALLFVEPSAAATYADALRAEEEAERERAAQPSSTSPEPGAKSSESMNDSGGLRYTVTHTPDAAVSTRQFFATAELDPVLAKKQFSDVVDEVLLQFTSQPGVKVRISIDIRAESEAGFDEGVQRAVRENCSVLKFRTAEFE